jgi:hypothetical protein
VKGRSSPLTFQSHTGWSRAFFDYLNRRLMLLREVHAAHDIARPTACASADRRDARGDAAGKPRRKSPNNGRQECNRRPVYSTDRCDTSAEPFNQRRGRRSAACAGWAAPGLARDPTTPRPPCCATGRVCANHVPLPGLTSGRLFVHATTVQRHADRKGRALPAMLHSRVTPMSAAAGPFTECRNGGPTACASAVRRDAQDYLTGKA